MQTVSEIAQHLNDVMSKENLAVAIVEDGNEISLRAIHSGGNDRESLKTNRDYTDAG